MDVEAVPLQTRLWSLFHDTLGSRLFRKGQAQTQDVHSRISSKRSVEVDRHSENHRRRHLSIRIVRYVLEGLHLKIIAFFFRSNSTSSWQQVGSSDLHDSSS